MNTHPRSYTREDFDVSSRPGGTDEKARLLEVRTESGTLYVCPSKWQRLRLLWTFRHFHVLPQQVLSRRDQHLIEKLARSAVITPIRPVPRNAVLGVVERARIRSLGSATQVVTMGTERMAQKTSRASTLFPGLPAPGHHQRLFFERPEPTVKPTKQATPGVRFRQWGALGMLTAVCLVVILVKSLVGSVPARTVQISKPPSAQVEQTAAPALPQAAALPVKPRHRPVSPLLGTAMVTRPNELLTSMLEPSLNKPALISPSAQRTFVVELPQGHFAAPIAADPNRVGELHLRALIAADGTVKSVTVVSGDPKLAKAGMRAVRRWRYNPYEASATQAERETLINMKFFGQDAVSVSSVAR